MGWPEIVATSRVYTEPWLARLMLANALGGRWLAMHGDDPGWPELIADATAPPRPPAPLRDLRLLDPCCGPGHILIVAVDLLAELYERERRLAGEGRIPAEWATAPGRTAAAIRANLAGCDTDAEAVAVCRSSLQASLGGAVRALTALPPGVGALARGRSALPLLRRSWDVVCTNPPYAGFRQMSPDVRAEIAALDPLARSDLGVAFVSRCLDLLADGGTAALLTPAAWLASAPAWALRRRVLDLGHPRVVVPLGQRVFPDAALVFAAVTVIDRGGSQSAVTQLRPARGGPASERRIAGREGGRRIPRATIEGLPGLPFVVDVDERVARRSQGAPRVGDRFRSCDGVWPRGADLVRDFREVDPDDDGWVRMSGGQGYARWYAGTSLRVRAEVAERWRGPRDGAIEYPRVAGGRLCARVAPAASVARAGIVRLIRSGVDDGRVEELLAIFNCPLGTRWLRTLSAGLNFNPGSAGRVPLGRRRPPESLVELVREAVDLSRMLVSLDPSKDEFAGTIEERPAQGETIEDATLRLWWEPQARLIAVERKIGRVLEVPAEDWALLPAGTPLERLARGHGSSAEEMLDRLRRSASTEIGENGPPDPRFAATPAPPC